VEEGSPTGGAGITRAMLRVSVACLTVAALIAIAALLGGDYGDTEARISLTVLAIAVYNVTGMAGVALARDRAAGWVGGLGVTASAVAFALAIVAIWWEVFVDGDEGEAIRVWGVATVLAVSLAQASLLLSRRRPSDGDTVGAILAGTLIAVAAIAILVIVAIAGEDVSQGYWRLLGAVAVLDVLGTILVPIVRRLHATSPDGAVAGSADIAARLGLDRAPASPAEARIVPVGALGPAVAEAARAGAGVLLGPTTGGEGGAFAVVVAPDGSHLALIEPPEGGRPGPDGTAREPPTDL